MASQKEMVLEYLKKKGSISQQEAIKFFSAYRLSDIIYKLRNEGYKIYTHSERITNKLGKEVTYGRYVLRLDQQVQKSKDNE